MTEPVDMVLVCDWSCAVCSRVGRRCMYVQCCGGGCAGGASSMIVLMVVIQLFMCGPYVLV